MRRSLIALSIVTSLAGGIVGCDHDKRPYAARRDPMNRADYPQIVIDENIEKFLLAGDPNVRGGDADRPLSVTVPMRSNSEHEFAVQYRFEFFDRDGRPVRSQPDWHWVRVPPRQEKVFEGAALDTNAADWRLVIRSSRSRY
jgi:uncharacterized protein YcfL